MSRKALYTISHACATMCSVYVSEKEKKKSLTQEHSCVKDRGSLCIPNKTNLILLEPGYCLRGLCAEVCVGVCVSVAMTVQQLPGGGGTPIAITARGIQGDSELFTDTVPFSLTARLQTHKNPSPSSSSSSSHRHVSLSPAKILPHSFHITLTHFQLPGR